MTAEEKLTAIRKLLDRYWLAQKPDPSSFLQKGSIVYKPEQLIEDVRQIVERPE